MTAAAAPTSYKSILALTESSLADLMEDFTIESALDLGTAKVLTGTHRVLGTLTLINTVGERQAVVIDSELQGYAVLGLLTEVAEAA